MIKYYMEDLIWLFCNVYTYKNIILYTTNTFDFHWLMKENLFKKSEYICGFVPESKLKKVEARPLKRLNGNRRKHRRSAL